MKGLVFNIQRFSINDGPGIRTTVFLKGCNLRCQWCHNPESINVHQELQHFDQLCIGCGACIEACPHSVISTGDDSKLEFDRKHCVKCGACVDACMSDAIELAGEYMDVEEVVETIAKDREYYENSGGGLTISGGEPLLQKDFVKEIFRRTKDMGIHNTLDTAAHVDWSVLEEVLPYVDLILLDMKVMDHDKHFESTGRFNHEILENAKRLADEDVDIIVRIPVIPSVNDTDENMDRTAAFLSDFERLVGVELLPYHTLGVDKNLSLGEKMHIKTFIEPEIEEMEAFEESFRRYDIKTQVG